MNPLHEWFIAPFEYGFMQRGLLSALLLGLSGGMLGTVLVLRRLTLMGDALSHSLLPGLALAWWFFGSSPLALFAGALLAGLLTALGSALVSRLTRVKEDAAFAALFILFFAGGIALLGKLPTQINLSHILFGHVLGAGPGDVRRAAVVSALTLVALLVFRRRVLLETFDPVFHRATGGRGGIVHGAFLMLTVLNLVAALQTMGVVLALGLFILPAVTAYLWCENFLRMMLLSAAIAVGGALIGILMSFHAGLPSGAAIVLSLGTVFVASIFLSPHHGMLARLRRSPQLRHPAAHGPAKPHHHHHPHHE